MSKVAIGNKKPMFSVRCKVTGVFLNNVTPNLECISITNEAKRAFLFPDFDAAMTGSQSLRASYGSFDWRPVEV